MTKMFYRWIWGSEVEEVDVEVIEGVTEAVTTLEGEIEGVTFEGVTFEGVGWTGVGST